MGAGRVRWGKEEKRQLEGEGETKRERGWRYRGGGEKRDTGGGEGEMGKRGEETARGRGRD